jgi:mono/diheme cytochrome c family protein
LRRIVVVPVVLFAVVSGAVFTLAKLHPAKPSTSAATTTLPTGDAVKGRAVYVQTCSGCHGTKAQGGVGPALAGAHITVEEARTQIDNGSGVMPAGLVKDTREADVLAYLQTIFASP